MVVLQAIRAFGTVRAEFDLAVFLIVASGAVRAGQIRSAALGNVTEFSAFEALSNS